MFRYLSLLWDATQAVDTESAETLSLRLRQTLKPWKRIADAKGLRVFVAGTRLTPGSHSLTGDAGVIVGSIFHRDNEGDSCAEHAVDFDERRTGTILDSCGRELIRSYWGRYVAFLSGPGGRRKWVVRAPASDLPCYMSRFGGVSVFYSCLADCMSITALKPVFDWDQIVLRVATGYHCLDTSALRDIITVYPGECIEVSPARSSRSFYWTPETVAADCVDSIADARVLMHTAVRSAVATSVSGHRNILHLLSGGLDSAIVLGCLAQVRSGAHITCLNIRAADRYSDERTYARAAAASSHCRLLERERSAAVRFEDLLRFAPQASPLQHIIGSLEVNPVVRVIATEVGATAVSNGNAGDVVFYGARTELAAADYALRYGITRQLLRLIADIGVFSQKSFWQILSMALEYRYLRRRWSSGEFLGKRRRLVVPEIAPLISTHPLRLNPWSVGAQHLGPGKLCHALSIGLPSRFYDPLEPDTPLDTLDPLSSQPVVEACLRIPTYLHSKDGRKRTLARQVFAAEIPAEIAARYWKSAVWKHCLDMLTANLTFSRELLLDGALVRQGLLNRTMLEESLSGKPSKNTADIVELLDYICVEAWLQSSASASQRLAA